MKNKKSLLATFAALSLVAVVGFTTTQQAMVHPPSVDGPAYIVNAEGDVHLTMYMLDHESAGFQDYLSEYCTLLETLKFDEGTSSLSYTGQGGTGQILVYSDKQEFISSYLEFDGDEYSSVGNISGGIRFDTTNYDNYTLTVDSENFLSKEATDDGYEMKREPHNSIPYNSDLAFSDFTFYVYQIG